MRLQVLTIYGFAGVDFTFNNDSVPGTPLEPPVVVEVDHYHVNISSLPVSLPRLANKMDHPVWIHRGKITTVSPVGPVGISIGSPVGMTATLSSDPTTIYHGVKFDFESTEHVFPVVSGTAATLSLYRAGTRLWQDDIVAGNTSSSGAGDVVLSVNRLGAYISVDTDGEAQLILPHSAGSLYDAAAVVSTVLLSVYLSLIVGFRGMQSGDKPDGMAADLRTRSLLLLVDGPLAALGIVLGASLTYDESAAWRYIRHWTIVAVTGAGVLLVLVRRLLGDNRNDGFIDDAERRLVEPAIAVALQSPFTGQLGVLSQLIAGIACAATCVRGAKIISTTTLVDKLESAFRLAVIGWLSPILIRTAMMDAMESRRFLWTYPPALAISMLVAMTTMKRQRIFTGLQKT